MTSTLNRNVDKCFEESEETGTLNVGHRNLKEFPVTVDNFDITDVSKAGKVQTNSN